jgi:hypothetical protein
LLVSPAHYERFIVVSDIEIRPEMVEYVVGKLVRSSNVLADAAAEQNVCLAENGINTEATTEFHNAILAAASALAFVVNETQERLGNAADAIKGTIDDFAVVDAHAAADLDRIRERAEGATISLASVAVSRPHGTHVPGGDGW